ncbi:NUDIX hydrolase [Pyruvatibacter mobilis]|uniref:NAD regulator n=1 Tax=Pyruvatibacter mobilis TaxID=1712261 RepID=A0A845QC17_9HYPH|nr:NAD regulator [Pyruvatibacter mobilis]NBG96195.1 NAD regulator [Pyruvatibacter mobilis]QJD75702.1 NAD regulator [Pyruvatibacter mobilis]GGD17838.1 NAD regulator [Pyruvatibacter mobilis]
MARKQTTAGPGFDDTSTAVVVGLNAAIVTIAEAEPRTLVVRAPGQWDALPFGPFDPLKHRTMDVGLRRWVQDQTKLDLGYVEQLYTFGDRGRHRHPEDTGPHIVSVGYLALVRAQDMGEDATAQQSSWRCWYSYFPWEDWRQGRPAIIDGKIAPLVGEWVARATTPALKARRRERLDLCFGLNGIAWDEEKVLERFELLYEAGLADEAAMDGRKNARRRLGVAEDAQDVPALGDPMLHDHRRILATAMGRLRAKLKYRPVVFELMAEEFTLTELQTTVEAVMGQKLHKQNFRRQVEKTGLVEGTGRMTTKTGGRPAEQFRFRREVVTERAAPGVRVGAPVRGRSSRAAAR